LILCGLKKRHVHFLKEGSKKDCDAGENRQIIVQTVKVFLGEIPPRLLYITVCHGGFMEVYPGITMDPAIRFGKPCITGTRIDVATVLGRFAAGDKIEDIQEDYQLTRDQVMAALAYATHVAEHLPPAVKSA
jgi:uncharacterized protein (DUF433 family)